MGCNKDLVLVDSVELAELQALVCSQQEKIQDLECKVKQLNGKLNSTRASKIIKPAKTKCSDSTSCGC